MKIIINRTEYNFFTNNDDKIYCDKLEKIRDNISKKIRDSIFWDSHLQEIEFRTIFYLDKNIVFPNCGSDENFHLNQINLLDINWNEIVCLDSKFFNESHIVSKNFISSYSKYFKYIKLFLESKGEKVFHPQIFVNSETFSLLKELIINLNNLFDLPINSKNSLELHIHFDSIKEKISDDLIKEIDDLISHSKFKMYERDFLIKQ